MILSPHKIRPGPGRWLAVVYGAICCTVPALLLLLCVSQGRGIPLGDIHDFLKGPELWQKSGDRFPGLGAIWESYEPCDDYPPPMMLLGQVLFLSLGGGLQWLQMTHLPCLLLFFFCFWCLSRSLFEQKTAILALILLLAENRFLWMLLAIGPEVVLLSLSVCTVLLLVRSDCFRSIGWSTLAGAALGLMALAKITFALHAAGPWLFCVLWPVLGRRWERRRTHGLVCALGAAAVVALPWYLDHLPEILCYLGGNLAARGISYPDFLFPEFLPTGLADVVHSLFVPLALGLVLAIRGIREARRVHALPAEQAGPAAGTLLCLTGAGCSLLAIFAAHSVRKSFPVLELTVALPLAALPLAHWLLGLKSRVGRGLVLGGAAALLVFNVATFIPAQRWAEMRRSSGPENGGGPAPVLTRTGLHQGIVGSLVRLGAAEGDKVAIVILPELPGRAILDPILLWYSSLSSGLPMRFFCTGCRPERYELSYERARRRQETIEISGQRLEVDAGARFLLLVGREPGEPVRGPGGGELAVRRVLHLPARALEGQPGSDGKTIPALLLERPARATTTGR